MSLTRFRLPTKSVVTKGSIAKQEQIHNLALSFSIPFNNYEDVNREECFNSLIFKTINFMIVGQDKGFLIEELFKKLSENFAKSKKFANSKIRTYCSNKDFNGLLEYINKIFNSFFPNIAQISSVLYLQTVYCLFKYFDFGKYLTSKNIELNNNIFYNLYYFCYLLTLEREIDYIGYKENRDAYIFNGLNSSANYLKDKPDFKYQSKYILDFVSSERREEYISMLNNFFDTWKTEEKASLRNRVNGLGLENFKLDWDSLFEVSEDFWKKEVFEEKYIDNDSFIEFLSKVYNINITKEKPKEYVEHLGMTLLYNAFCEISTLSIYCENSFETMISYEFIKKSQNDFEESVKEKDKNKDNEIASLKSENKNFKRSVSKFEKDFESCQQEIESLKKELEIKQASVVDSEEYESLRVEVESKSTELSEKIEEVKKSDKKIAWYEEKVKELENQLKYYSEIESDLMTLQNENNVLSSQIHEFEVIEEDTEEEYNKKLNLVKDKHIVFIGGTGGMMRKYLKTFTNSEYIDITEQGTSFTISPSVDYVVIYTRMVTHAHCERAGNYISKDKIIPINICNIKMVVNELYRLMKTEK